MMIRILLTVAGLIPLAVYGQIGQLSEPVPKVKDLHFIKVQGEQHNLVSTSSRRENIRLTQLEKGVIQYDSLNCENKVVFTAKCTVRVSMFQISWGADSIRYVPKKGETKEDSITPQEVYEYSTKLVREGMYIHFDPSGERKVQGWYRNGFKHGVWKYFDSKGKVVKREKWSYDRLKKTRTFHDQ